MMRNLNLKHIAMLATDRLNCFMGLLCAFLNWKYSEYEDFFIEIVFCCATKNKNSRWYQVSRLWYKAVPQKAPNFFLRSKKEKYPNNKNDRNKFFFFFLLLYVGPPKEDIFFDHLLWSIFQFRCYTCYKFINKLKGHQNTVALR